MAEANNSNPSDKFNLEATAHEQSQVIQVGLIIADTVIFGTAQRTGKPFQAPSLPTYYVDRPEYSQDLKKRLLTESSDVRTLVVTAIHGLGAIGKSTLATALAHDQDVQNHFCDGILWVTLGQKPNLLPLLSGWVQQLGDNNFKATSVEATSNHLRTLLHDKAVLLVVDDAWNTEDAQAFKVGGARCQVLVTTREAGIAEVLGASTFSLDVMQPSQAMELLTKKLGRNLGETETQEAEALAKAVGYLPLALDLAAAQVDCGTAWTVLLQDMQQEVARLKTLDDQLARDANDEASLKRLSLTASLNLSIKRLPPQEREDFIWLGILPEDVNITQKMIATLWDMDDERDTADELRYFQRKALLLPGVPLMDKTPTYRLHDLFHDLARNLLTAPTNPKRRGNLPGLGITLPVAHATFLDKYRTLTHKNLWHTLSSDGYIHQHLVWHLEKAEKIEEIHKLLAEESETGGNGWYEACDRLGQTANFVTDVARAWELAEASWTETTLPQVVGLQCRYALMITSLNSLTANIPVELLIALVQKNVWTLEQAFAYIQQSSNPEKKVYLLTQLANHLPPNFKTLAFSKALAVARGIQDEVKRANVLFILAEELPLEFLPEVLADARKIQHELSNFLLIPLAAKLPELLEETRYFLRQIFQDERIFHDEKKCTQLLILLAPKLSSELSPEVIAAARQIKNKEKRAEVLILLAPKLPELLPEAVAAIREIPDEGERMRTLITLTEKLPPELLTEVLPAAREIQDESDRADALFKLANKLPELYPEVLATVKEISDESDRASFLRDLAEELPLKLLPEVLAAVREIPDEEIYDDIIRTLALKLPELLPEALASAREIWDMSKSSPSEKSRPLGEALAIWLYQKKSSSAKALFKLTDKLPELLPEALDAARKIWDEEKRAKALSELADRMPELLPEVLAAAREIESDSKRTDAIIKLVPKLPPELLLQALAATRRILDEEKRADAVRALAPKLPELLPEALASVKEIQDERKCYNALRKLVLDLPSELFPEALSAAKEIKNEYYRAKILSNLADKLPPELLPEALSAVMEIKDESNRAEALSNLVEKLPPELLPEALSAARQIKREFDHAKVLNTLADKLPELLPEALAYARQIEYERFRAYALSDLADKLPGLFPEVLATVRQLEDEGNCTDVLSHLADKLPPELLPEALSAAKEIENVSSRARVLNSLADRLPELLPEVLAIARQIEDESNRANVLSDLAPKLPPELLPEALSAAKEIEDESNRANVLSDLAPKLPPELLPEALSAAKEIEDESNRAKVLSHLADRLPELFPEALVAASQISYEKRRVYALSALAEKLSQVQKNQLFPLWQDILHTSSFYTRKYVLTDIQAFTPVIFSLGGQQAVKNTASAIQDVSRWWG